MFGESIPCYAREYLREWQRYDRFLRLRWSLDEPGRFILERKTRYTTDHVFERGTDRQAQLADGYRMVMRFDPRDIRWVLRSLQLTDIQRRGGYKALAEELRLDDDRAVELVDRAGRAEFEAVASEHFDRIAWDEKRRVVSGVDLGG